MLGVLVFGVSWSIDSQDTNHQTIRHPTLALIRADPPHPFHPRPITAALMQVRVNLMGGLKSKAPPANRLELPDGADVMTALRQLGLEARQLQVVMHNGKPQANHATVLKPDDELTILPPVGGG